MHRQSPTRIACALVASVAVAALAAGCGGDDRATVVQPGEVVDGSATAYVGAHPVVFMVPSGRVTITVGDPVGDVGGIDTANGEDIVASPGTTLVGVTWTLDRGAYPNTVNYQVAAPATVLGAPRDIDLTLVAGHERTIVPGVGTMAGLGGRPSTTVWAAVPAGASSYAVDLGYDGLTQVGDVATGMVEPQAASPLYRPLPDERTVLCSVSRGDLASCLVDYAVGYPYVDGVGWAATGSTFALVALHTAGSVGAVTLDGAAATASISDEADTFHAFRVATGARHLVLRARVADRPAPLALTARLEQGDQ